MPPQLAVGGEERGSQECGELAGRGSAQQVHLEEPILSVQIAEREGEVASILRRDGRHSGGIAAHADLRPHSGSRYAAVEARQARAQRQPSGERRDNRGGGEDDGRQGAEAQCSAHRDGSRVMARLGDSAAAHAPPRPRR